jgi:RNA polymerase sigma-70 factor (ECF subfamily)
MENGMARGMTDIWQEVHDDLRTFIAKRVANDAAVEDILQEVFLRMHRKLNSLKDPRRVVSWLFQITRYAVIDYYRSTQRLRETPAGLTVDLEAMPTALPLKETDADSGQPRTELAGCLRPMIEKLSPHYREAVMLVELEGLTQKDAATRLGISVSGMKSRIQRGRTQLKRMLEECCLIELDRRHGIVDYALRDASAQACRPSPRTV